MEMGPLNMNLLAAADRIEAEETQLTNVDVAPVLEAIRKVRPDLAVTDAELRSVEKLLHFVDRVVPGWNILLRGKALEPDGHWICTLRESVSRDSDEYIGIGKGASLSSAILAAILRVIEYQTHQ
jgi:hypothetical protein